VRDISERGAVATLHRRRRADFARTQDSIDLSAGPIGRNRVATIRGTDRNAWPATPRKKRKLQQRLTAARETRTIVAGRSEHRIWRAQRSGLPGREAAKRPAAKRTSGFDANRDRAPTGALQQAARTVFQRRRKTLNARRCHRMKSIGEIEKSPRKKYYLCPPSSGNFRVCIDISW